MNKNGFNSPFRITPTKFKSETLRGTYNGYDSMTGEAIIHLQKGNFQGERILSGFATYNTLIHEATHALQSQIATENIREQYPGQQKLLSAQIFAEHQGTTRTLVHTENEKMYVINNPSLYISSGSRWETYVMYRLQPMERQAVISAEEETKNKLLALQRRLPSEEVGKALEELDRHGVEQYMEAAETMFKTKNPLKAYDQSLLYLSGGAAPSREALPLFRCLQDELFMANMEYRGCTLEELEVKTRSNIGWTSISRNRYREALSDNRDDRDNDMTAGNNDRDNDITVNDPNEEIGESTVQISEREISPDDDWER